MRHQLVRALLVYFLERAGYSGAVRVFTRREPFDRLCRKRSGALTETERASLAVTLHGKTPATWVNTTEHKTLAALADTCAHEAAHVVLGPGFPHGRPFDRRVRRLLRGGVL